MSLFDQYFEEHELKEGFLREYVSLWSGWLGKDQLYKLNEVTVEQWSLFNDLLRLLSHKFELHSVNLDKETSVGITDIESLIDTYDCAMDKNACNFTRIVIPELDAVYTEEWDYTWILWYKSEDAKNRFNEIVIQSGLCHFSD